tara:strand:- start:1511 stop:2182 length:672 start_codon:yes stop_codon:yes gene_type:complete
VQIRVNSIRTSIDKACENVGRNPKEVQIICVSKTHDLSEIVPIHNMGFVDFGENRVQELVPKAKSAIDTHLNVNWHFIGHLQRNKVRQILPFISTLHSLDSIELLNQLTKSWESDIANESRKPLQTFIEVNISGEQQKYGIKKEELQNFLNYARNNSVLEILGLMTVPPKTETAEQVRPIFRELHELASIHGLKHLSMGMSDDYRVAIEEGATIVRIGRAFFE